MDRPYGRPVMFLGNRVGAAVQATTPSPDNILVSAFGAVTSLGQVYNDAQLIGTRCAVLAVLVSLRNIYKIARNNPYPHVRRCLISVLLLVPIYAIDACCGLQHMRFAVPRQLLREAYEAYALLAFMQFILNCLGGPDGAAVRLEDEGCHSIYTSSRFSKIGGALSAKTKVFITKCGSLDVKVFEIYNRVTGTGSPRPCTAGTRFIRNVQFGVWQYAVVCGLLGTTLALVAWTAGVYHDGCFETNDAYLYCTALQFASQSWALWSMVQLLHRSKKSLQPVRPILKFMCIKLLIFFTWSQSVAILVLENISSLDSVSLWIETSQSRTVTHWWYPFGWFDSSRREVLLEDAWQQDSVRRYVGTGLGSFVLCLEMLCFAVLHSFAFPSSEWDPRSNACAGCRLLGEFHSHVAQREPLLPAIFNDEHPSATESMLDTPCQPQEAIVGSPVTPRRAAYAARLHGLVGNHAEVS